MRPGCAARTHALPSYSRHPFSFALVGDRFLLFLCCYAFVNGIHIHTLWTLCPETMKLRCKERYCLFPSIFLRNGELRKMMGIITLLPSSPSFTPTRNEVQHPPALSGPHVRTSMPQLCYRDPCLPPPLPASHNPSLMVLTLKCPQVLRWSSALKYFSRFLLFPTACGGRVPKPECAFALHPC